ncbi:MAG: hypothetical protein ACE5R6_09250, partial [Candidatus Heimdallarchaeota archaeon]
RQEPGGEDTSKIGRIFCDTVPNPKGQLKRRLEKRFHKNFTEPTLSEYPSPLLGPNMGSVLVIYLIKTYKQITAESLIFQNR